MFINSLIHRGGQALAAACLFLFIAMGGPKPVAVAASLFSTPHVSVAQINASQASERELRLDPNRPANPRPETTDKVLESAEQTIQGTVRRAQRQAQRAGQRVEDAVEPNRGSRSTASGTRVSTGRNSGRPNAQLSGRPNGQQNSRQASNRNQRLDINRPASNGSGNPVGQAIESVAGQPQRQSSRRGQGVDSSGTGMRMQDIGKVQSNAKNNVNPSNETGEGLVDTVKDFFSDEG